MYSEVSIISWIVISLVCGWVAARIYLLSWPASGLTKYIFGLSAWASVSLAGSTLAYVINLNQTSRTLLLVAANTGLMFAVAHAWMVLWFVYLKGRNVSSWRVIVPVAVYVVVMSITDFMLMTAHPPKVENSQYYIYWNEVWHVAFALGFTPLVLLGVYFLVSASRIKGISRIRSISWGLLFALIGTSLLLGPVINTEKRDIFILFSGCLFAVFSAIFLVYRAIYKRH